MAIQITQKPIYRESEGRYEMYWYYLRKEFIYGIFDKKITIDGQPVKAKKSFSNLKEFMNFVKSA